ncbi:MAG TPA: hypothetical protein VE987_05365 [Polyangiaceae bacterium]|nr:hypothetical protein [Polyangiaceae bacterium]
MTATLRVWTRDQIIATWQQLVIVVYRLETTISGTHAVQETFDELARQYPGVFVLTVVEEHAPIPAPDVRAMMARFLLTRAPQIVLSAVVYEGTGFRAAAVRTVVTGLALVSKLPYRHKIFATVEDAARWFAESSPVAHDWGEAAIVDVVTKMREPAAMRA